MNTIQQWTAGICLAVLALSLVQYLMPEGALHKTAELAAGAFFLCAVLIPVLQAAPDFSFLFSLPSLQPSESLQDTVEEQKELLKYGAYMEHCYTTFATGKVDFAETLNQIKAIGPDHVILGTDLGQKTAPYPDEGLEEFATKLYENGFSADDVRKMTVKNTTALVEG